MAGLPTTSVEQFLGALLGSIGDVTAVPGATPKIIGAAVAAIADISAKSFEYVWIANMVIGLVTTTRKLLMLLDPAAQLSLLNLFLWNSRLIHGAIVCCFLKPVDESMTVHIESALEIGKLRDKQLLPPP